MQNYTILLNSQRKTQEQTFDLYIINIQLS